MTPDQFRAVFADVAKTVAPAEVRPPTLSEQLSAHRKVLLQYRKKGYSLEQLAAMLRTPAIGIDASHSFLKKFLSTRTRGGAARKARE